MPGILGIVGGSVNKALINLMTSAMRHEDFYSIETYVDEEFPAAFGVVGLNIQSLENDNIVFNEDGNLLALMDGEIFDYDDYRRNLIAKGHRFKTKGDAEFFLHLYEELGDNLYNLLVNIKGRFVIAIYDKTKNVLILANDKYGFKPLYFTQFAGKYLFASEIKAILKYPKIGLEINFATVADIAFFDYPLGEKTLIKNILHLPPAAFWIFREGKVQKKTYWNIESLLDLPPISMQETLREAPSLFRRIVRNYTKKGDRVGVTLTAGYDTRTILSAIDCKKTPVHTFTYEMGDEIQLKIAQQVARIAGCKHMSQKLLKSYASELPEYVNKTIQITDGMSNISMGYYLYVFKEQRKFADIFLSGQCAEGLVRGPYYDTRAFSSNLRRIITSQYPEETLNSILKQGHWRGYFSHELLMEYSESVRESLMVNLIEKHSKFSLHEKILFFILHEALRHYYSGEMKLEETQVMIRLPFVDDDFIRFIVRTPLFRLNTQPFSRSIHSNKDYHLFYASVIRENNPNLARIKTDRGYSPFVSLLPLGYLLALPIRILTRSYRRILNIPGSPDFSVPLVSYGKNLFSEKDTCKRGYYDSKKLEKMMSLPLGKDVPEWQQFTKVMTFELWLRQFID